MPVPNSITDLSKNAAENSPAGTESAKGTIDDYFRAHASFIKQLFDQLLGAPVTLASASTVNIGFAAAMSITINGTATINAFDSWSDGTMRWLTFNGALTLTHSSALQLPGAANIVTGSGDVAVFKSLGNGNWKCMAYMRMSGTGAVAADASRDGYLKAADWAWFNNKQQAGVCLPMSGGVMSGGLTLNNFISLFLKDAGGTPRQMLYMDDGNTTNLLVAGGTILRILSQGGAGEVWRIDNVGNVRQVGAQVQKVLGAGGTFRVAHHIQQADGTIRMQLALDTDESPTLVTYSTAGGYSGGIKFNNGGVDASGAITGQTLTGRSDERLKKKWRRRPADFLPRIARLKKLGDFLWKKGSIPGIGGSAQEIEEIWPEAVHTDEKGIKSVNYGAAAFVIAVELARAFFAFVDKTNKRLAKLEAK